MSDNHTHGLLQSNPPQTYCGFAPTGRKVTTDPFHVTCPDCKRLMKITGDMPNLSDEIEQPRKERL